MLSSTRLAAPAYSDRPRPVTTSASVALIRQAIESWPRSGPCAPAKPLWARTAREPELAGHPGDSGQKRARRSQEEGEAEPLGSPHAFALRALQPVGRHATRF